MREDVASAVLGVLVLVLDLGGRGRAAVVRGMVSVIAHRVVDHDSDHGHTVTAELYADGRLGGHPC
ncbi:hypothetical protein [Streptomyces griseofuscus]|uniref:hypothetical protein n=1 Tax=Streptomyces griseofuscus TaxID=146922 RepID=UPI003F4CBACA